MKKYLFIFVVTLAGCDGAVVDANGFRQEKTDWQMAPQTHQCTEQQRNLVERDTAFCNKNTSYFTTYCYGAAILRNCTLKGKP